jgi:hypothetical protein
VYSRQPTIDPAVREHLQTVAQRFGIKFRYLKLTFNHCICSVVLCCCMYCAVHACSCDSYLDCAVRTVAPLRYQQKLISS